MHTVAAFACIALIPLAPAAMWAYARVTSVGRATAVARNEQTLRSIRHLAGARRAYEARTYPVYRWDVEGGLVPVAGYRTDVYLRLPRPVAKGAVVRHYVRALAGWHSQVAADHATFTRGGVTVQIQTAETGYGKRRVREYGVYVSQ